MSRPGMALPAVRSRWASPAAVTTDGANVLDRRPGAVVPRRRCWWRAGGTRRNGRTGRSALKARTSVSVSTPRVNRWRLLPLLIVTGTTARGARPTFRSVRRKPRVDIAVREPRVLQSEPQATDGCAAGRHVETIAGFPRWLERTERPAAVDHRWRARLDPACTGRSREDAAGGGRRDSPWTATADLPCAHGARTLRADCSCRTDRHRLRRRVPRGSDRPTSHRRIRTSDRSECCSANRRDRKCPPSTRANSCRRRTGSAPSVRTRHRGELRDA